MIPFTASGCPPKQSTLVCMVCKMPPTCVGACKARIYFACSDNPKMTRAAIHLGDHGHPVARGMYRNSTEVICGLIAEKVAKTPTATNSTITLSASKDFLGHYLFHNGEGEKKMLKVEEMVEVMDRFQYLSSPSICNVISFFRSNNHRGIIDNIIIYDHEERVQVRVHRRQRLPRSREGKGIHFQDAYRGTWRWSGPRKADATGRGPTKCVVDV